MPYVMKTGVVGVAVAPSETGNDRSLEELLYRVTQEALADAGMTIEDIDGIVVASNDQYDGRAISVMMASAAVGGVDRDILSTPSAGEHAFVMGALRVATGQYRTQLVVSWSPTEAAPLREAQRLANDPYFHRRLPLDEVGSYALQAGALIAKIPGVEAVAQKVTEKNRANGRTAYPSLTRENADAEKLPWPLQPGMVSRPTTGAVALVLASQAYVDDHPDLPVAWVSGMGWATETAYLGDRDLTDLQSLREAARQAYSEAGITDPAGAVGVAEVSDATPYQELLALEALGLAPRDQWAARLDDGTFGPGGKLPVNPSGGATSLNPVYCTGLMRIAEVARRVLGRGGDAVRAGLAHAASGFAMQYNTVVVLRRDKDNAQGAAA